MLFVRVRFPTFHHAFVPHDLPRRLQSLTPSGPVGLSWYPTRDIFRTKGACQVRASGIDVEGRAGRQPWSRGGIERNRLWLSRLRLPGPHRPRNLPDASRTPHPRCAPPPPRAADPHCGAAAPAVRPRQRHRALARRTHAYQRRRGRCRHRRQRRRRGRGIGARLERHRRRDRRVQRIRPVACWGCGPDCIQPARESYSQADRRQWGYQDRDLCCRTRCWCALHAYTACIESACLSDVCPMPTLVITATHQWPHNTLRSLKLRSSTARLPQPQTQRT